MMANELNHQEISMFADNDLATLQVDALSHALRQPELQASWGIYHQIGDILRSDEMAIPFSAGFSARMAARLDAEPAYLMPVATAAATAQSANPLTKSAAFNRRRLVVPGLVAAAAAAYFVVPQWMAATGTHGLDSSRQVATNQQAAMRNLGMPLAQSVQPTSLVSNEGIAPKAALPSDTQVVVLRDSRIDEYLLAHQRFSPSMYSPAQFARSATFASDANK